MNSSHAILICDREPFFREALVNLLLTAGYTRVEVVTTMREALRKLRRHNYSHVLIGIASSALRSLRLGRIAQQRQPRAKIIFLVRAQERDAVNAVIPQLSVVAQASLPADKMSALRSPQITKALLNAQGFDCIIKELASLSLLDVMSDTRSD